MGKREEFETNEIWTRKEIGEGRGEGVGYIYFFLFNIRVCDVCEYLLCYLGIFWFVCFWKGHVVLFVFFSLILFLHERKQMTRDGSREWKKGIEKREQVSKKFIKKKIGRWNWITRDIFPFIGERSESEWISHRLPRRKTSQRGRNKKKL